MVLKLRGLTHLTKLAAGRLTRKKEPVLIIDVREERERKVITVNS
jgi:hypothetical protein